jgi:hypothetical protein
MGNSNLDIVCYLFVDACHFCDHGCKSVFNIHRYFDNIFLGHDTSDL